MEGWIKLHRKTLDNPIVMKDSAHFAVWAYLLLNATHAEKQAIFKGKRIVLQPGQLITGCISISDKLKLNESKVRRVLNDFQNDGQIDRQTSNKNSLISILNWGLYQKSDGQSDGKNDRQPTDNRQTKNQKVTTNKNVFKQESKNERNRIYYPTSKLVGSSDIKKSDVPTLAAETDPGTNGGTGEHDEAGTKKLIFMPISIGFSDKSWYADE